MFCSNLEDVMILDFLQVAVDGERCLLILNGVTREGYSYHNYFYFLGVDKDEFYRVPLPMPLI